MNIICKSRSSQKGLSLIEVLIGVFLSSLIMLALLFLYIAGQKYFFNQGAKADTIEDSSYPSEWISRDIRGAIQVVGTYVGSSEQYTTSDEVLVLQVPSIDATETIIPGSFDYIVYRRNPNSQNFLERIVDAADDSARPDSSSFIADNVSDIVFKYYASDGTEPPPAYEDSFNIHYEIVSTNRSVWRGGQPFQETFRSLAKIRNKAFE